MVEMVFPITEKEEVFDSVRSLRKRATMTEADCPHFNAVRDGHCVVAERQRGIVKITAEHHSRFTERAVEYLNRDAVG